MYQLHRVLRGFLTFSKNLLVFPIIFGKSDNLTKTRKLRRNLEKTKKAWSKLAEYQEYFEKDWKSMKLLDGFKELPSAAK